MENVMSAVNENTNPPIPESPHPPLSPSHIDACPPVAIGASLPPAAAPRPPKSAVLPEVARLALEGFSGRAIGRRLGVPARTVDRWLQELRQEWARRAEEDAAQLVPVTLARLELAYREAMEAWRRSLDDKETRSETGGEGAAAEKTCVRRTTQSGQAALLRTVIHAAKEVYTFKAEHLARRRAAEAAEAERVRAAEDAEAERVREEIAGELESLHHTDLKETREIVLETSWETEAREPEELAEAINALPGEEYPKLREHCRCASGIELPFRRTTPWRVRPTESGDETSDPPGPDADLPDSLGSGDEAAGGTTCAATRHPQAGALEPAGFNEAGTAPAESGYTEIAGMIP